MRIKSFTLLFAFLLIPLLLTVGVPTQPVHAATITVTTTADSGAGSLRQAIADATSGDVITFDAALSGQTILLASQLRVNKTLTINGNDVITISGNDVTRVFTVDGSGNLTLNNLSIINGRLTGSTIIKGAGIYNSGTLIINNSTLSGNQALSSYGGGIYNDGTVSIVNSTISGNSANSRGGGIFSSSSSGTVSIVNSTISGNSADSRGGGIYIGGTVSIVNSTISGNSADSYGGGGIYIGAGVVNIKHVIIANNTSFRGPDCHGTINSQGYNLIKKTVYCTINVTTGDITGQDPQLGALADNGGPTFTHMPANDSPVIDKIPNADCAAAPTNGIDQRGAARNYDNTGSSANDCDIGAVERRETISVGSCAGADLTGVQPFNFATSGNQVAVDLNTTIGLKCITVEEMGPGANHLLATGSVGNPGIHTDNWWHITGNITTSLDVDITLPYASPSSSSRVCKWRGNLGGFGWDCGPLDGSGTTFTASSVTRTGLTSFSDWAVGDNVGPTAVSLHSITATSNTALLPILIATLLLAVAGGVVVRRRAA